MSEPERRPSIVHSFPEANKRDDGPEIARGLRVRSTDYGAGTVIAVLSIGVQIWWDEPLTGTTDSHMLVHDRSYVERLEKI